MAKYIPATKEVLQALVKDESIHLGDIDTSKITDMDFLFLNTKRADFSGIETWDVSRVENMRDMFHNAVFFNQDISKWNTSSVETPSLEDMIKAVEDGDNEFVLNFLDEYEHNGWNENDFIQLRQSAEYCENEEILDAIDSSGLIPEEYYDNDNVRTM